MSVQERQLSTEENKATIEIQIISVDNRMASMREAIKLQSEFFTDKEILGMIPEAKGMLEAHNES